MGPFPGIHQTQGVLLCDKIHEGEALALGGGQVRRHVHEAVGVVKAVLVELGEQPPLLKSRGKVADHDSPHILAVAPIPATRTRCRPLRRHCPLMTPAGVRHVVRRGAGGIGRGDQEDAEQHQGDQTMRARCRRCSCRCLWLPREATLTCSGTGLRRRESRGRDGGKGYDGKGEGRGAEGRGGPR